MDTRVTRIAFLRDRVRVAQSAADRSTFDVPFRQRQVALVKIDVPIGFPLFNIQSGRTRRAQTEWLEQNSRPPDFFTDPEDEEVQRVQHELLLGMIDQSGLAQDLDRRQQRNPIALTYDGFIVDGNRRVAALRGQGSTENVTAVLLPEDATLSEIFETELELQMARDTRADYNWVDQGLHVRYGIEKLGEQIGSVAQRMNVSEQAVRDILKRMALVDLYLKWRETPEAYHRVPPDSEQAFVELADRDSRQQFQSLPELHRRAIRYACFGVIHSEGGYMDVRRVADFIRSQPSEVVARVRQRLEQREDLADLADRMNQRVEGTEAPAADDILAQLASAEGPVGTPPGAELLNVVSNARDAQSSAPIIMQIVSDLDEESREAQAHLEPLRKVERALQLLRGVSIGDETKRLDEVATQLGEIMTEAQRLANAITHRVSQSD